MSFDRRKFSIINDDRRLKVALAPFWQSHKYTNPTKAIKIRRSGDSATADFGFLPNNEFDTQNAKDWIDAGGGSQEGFCDTFYDQAGFGNDIIQSITSTQPKILFDVLGFNSNILALDFATKRMGNFPFSETFAGDYTFFAVIKTPSVVNSAVILEGISGVDFTRLQYLSNRTVRLYDQTGHLMTTAFALNTDTYYIIAATIRTPAANSYIHINGVQRASTNDFTGQMGGLNLGSASGGSLDFLGQIPAFFAFNGAFNDTDRQNVEAELNRLYNIY